MDNASASTARQVAPIDKFHWVILYAVSVFIAFVMETGNLMGAIGYMLPSFMLGMLVAAVVWMFRRHWRWYDWMNVGGYIGFVLVLSLFFLTPALESYVQP